MTPSEHPDLLSMRIRPTDREVELLFSSGLLRADFPYDFPGITELSWSRHAGVFRVKFAHGDHAIVELPLPDGGDRQGGRTVVYLDQNMWSNLYRVRFDSTHIPTEEKEAAEWLMDLVADETIIVPFSVATLVETSRYLVNEPARSRIASTVLRVSRGWQMISHFRVLREDLARALGDQTPRRSPWSLIPGAWASEGALRAPEPWGGSVPFEAEGQAMALHISTILAVIEGNDRSSQLDSQWANGWANLAAEIGKANISPTLVRRAAHIRLISDFEYEVVPLAKSLGLTKDQFEEWLHRQSDQRISDQPYLGIVAEVIKHKLANYQQRWEANDLFDIFYHGGAAGLADVVVGEKKTTNLILRSSRALERNTNAYKSLTELRRSGFLERHTLQ